MYYDLGLECEVYANTKNGVCTIEFVGTAWNLGLESLHVEGKVAESLARSSKKLAVNIGAGVAVIGPNLGCTIVESLEYCNIKADPVVKSVPYTGTYRV